MTNPARTDKGVARVVRTLLSDIRELAASPPPLGVRAVERPVALLAGLADVANGLKAAWQRSVDERNAVYSARRESAQAVVSQREKRLRAYAKRERMVVPAEEGKFIVAGRVTDVATGIGLANVRVNAFDLDRKYDDRLGTARTDALGYFRIDYTAADFADLRDGQPETYIEVLDDQGRAIYTSPKSFVEKAGSAEFITARVDGEKVPEGLSLGRRVRRSVDRRIRGLERRGRELRLRSDLAPPTSRRPGVPVGERRPTGPMPPETETEPRTGREVEERPTPPSTVTRRKEPRGPVSDVDGIGPVFAARLAARNVTDVSQLVDMHPAKLAEVLEIGEARAKTILSRARDLLKRRRR